MIHPAIGVYLIPRFGIPKKSISPVGHAKIPNFLPIYVDGGTQSMNSEACMDPLDSGQGRTDVHFICMNKQSQVA